jgi:hypothetical protein
MLPERGARMQTANHTRLAYESASTTLDSLSRIRRKRARPLVGSD